MKYILVKGYSGTLLQRQIVLIAVNGINTLRSEVLKNSNLICVVYRDLSDEMPALICNFITYFFKVIITEIAMRTSHWSDLLF